MMSEESKPKVTIEDLLQLKRAERPSPEFWTRFEAELRAKQLAAIVRRKSWWQEALSAPWARGLRWSAPLGAAAIFAISFHAFQNNGHGPAADSSGSVGAVVNSSPRPDDRSAVRENQQVASNADSTPVSSAAEKMPVSADPAPVRQAANPWVGSVLLASDAPAQNGPSMSADHLSASGVPSFDQARGEFFAQAAFLGDHLRPSAVSATRSEPKEPLAQISGPVDSRKARLMAVAEPLPETDVTRQAASTLRDRIASRLSDDALYDSVHRLALGGNHVSIRF